MNKDQAYYAKKYKQLGRDRKRMIFHGLWFDPELNRYINLGRCRPIYSGYLKRQCNKRVRRENLDYTKMRSYYRKINEFWWDLY